MTESNLATETAQTSATDQPDSPPADQQTPADPTQEAPASEDSSPSGAAQTGDEPEAPEEKSTRSPRAEQRIAELNARAKASEESAEYWRNVALERARAASPPAAAEPVDDGPPAFESFHSTDEWAKAHATWVEQRAEAKIEAGVAKALAAREAKQSAETEAGAFQSRVDAFRVEHPDFDVVMSNPKLAITVPMVEAIKAEDNGLDVGLYLGNHPDEALRISKLPPVKQVAEVVRHAERLKAAPAPAPKAPPPRRSAAPPPPAPVTAGGTPQKDLEKMPLNDYMRERQKWAGNN